MNCQMVVVISQNSCTYTYFKEKLLKVYFNAFYFLLSGGCLGHYKLGDRGKMCKIKTY